MTDPNGTSTTTPADETEKLRSQMQHWMAKATDFEKRFSGIDPERYKLLEGEVAELRKKSAVGDEKAIEELLSKTKSELEAEAQKRYGQKITELESTKEELSKELNTLKVVQPTMMKAAEKFNQGLDLIQMLVERDCYLDGGKVKIKGQDGKPKASVKDPRQDMEVEEYLESLVEQYSGFAKPKGKPGTRDAGFTTGANGATTGVTVERYAKMTPQERQSIPALERGKLAQELMARGGRI